MNPDRRPYRTRDGYIGVNVYADHHWKRFFLLTGHAEMADDPRFNNIGGRTEHIAHLYAFLARVFETRTTAEWVSALTEADIPAIGMNTPETLIDDPHMRAVEFSRSRIIRPKGGSARSALRSSGAKACRNCAIRRHGSEHSVALLTGMALAVPKSTRCCVPAASTRPIPMPIPMPSRKPRKY